MSYRSVRGEQAHSGRHLAPELECHVSVLSTIYN